jgi:hypothetical protein
MVVHTWPISLTLLMLQIHYMLLFSVQILLPHMKMTVFLDMALQKFVRITETSTYFYETIWCYKG